MFGGDLCGFCWGRALFRGFCVCRVFLFCAFFVGFAFTFTLFLRDCTWGDVNLCAVREQYLGATRACQCFYPKGS